MATVKDVSTGLAIDGRSLDRLKHSASSAPDAAVRDAARQFEALFMNMLLKSMREALPREDMLASDASRMASGMLDEQWAQEMSHRGLGLADLMLRQLSQGQARSGDTELLKKLRAATAAAAPPRGPAAGLSGDARAVAAGTGKEAVARPGAPQEFVRRMMGHAAEAQKSTGVPAHFIVGQAALESGWGRREILSADGRTTHNLFGIKAGRDWTGPTANVMTTEYVGGVPRRMVQTFRAYSSYAEAFRDYGRLLAGNSRYAAVLSSGAGAAEFASRMQAAGYATDPAYARKLTQVINQTLALQGVA